MNKEYNLDLMDESLYKRRSYYFVSSSNGKRSLDISNISNLDDLEATTK